MSVTPQELQIVARAAGDVKQLLDALKAAGVNSPYLNAADNLAGAVQASLASGTFDPRALIPPMVLELNDIQSQVSSPTAKAILGRLASFLGKLVPAPPAS